MTRREILQAAHAAVCAQGQRRFGPPERGLGVVAQLWEPYLRSRCVSPGADVTVTAEDVALLMALLKIGRICLSDGEGELYADLAGYAACGGEIATEDAPLTPPPGAPWDRR